MSDLCQYLGLTPILDRAAWRGVRRLRIGFRAGLLCLGLLQAWRGWTIIDPDSISYLDMADAARGGDWAAFVNAYWSPLYPLLLAATLGSFQPNYEWLFPAAYLLNVLIFAGTLFCFEKVMDESLVWMCRRAGEERLAWSARATRWFLAGGYLLFAWGTLVLMTVRRVSPDLMVAGIGFAVAAVVLRIRCAPERWSLHLLLGALLGLGYWTKTVFFPLAVPVLLIGFLLGKHR